MGHPRQDSRSRSCVEKCPPLSRGEPGCLPRKGAVDSDRERFHSKVHSVTEVQPIYDLVVAKGDTKLVPVDPADKNREEMGIRNQVLAATGVPVSSLLTFLSGECQRDVVDRTGLSGEFKMSLGWSR